VPDPAPTLCVPLPPDSPLPTMTNDPMLTIHDLPPRPTGLSDDALSDVFGGCRNEGGCVYHSECCGDLRCVKPHFDCGHES